jgi:hypothetical protein
MRSARENWSHERMLRYRVATLQCRIASLLTQKQVRVPRTPARDPPSTVDAKLPKCARPTSRTEKSRFQAVACHPAISAGSSRPACQAGRCWGFGRESQSRDDPCLQGRRGSSRDDPRLQGRELKAWLIPEGVAHPGTTHAYREGVAHPGMPRACREGASHPGMTRGRV